MSKNSEVITFENYDLKDNYNLYYKFGWRAKSIEEDKIKEILNASYPQTIDLQRIKNSQNNNLIGLEHEYFALQVEINKYIWSKIVAKPKFSKKFNNVMGYLGIWFAFLISVILFFIETLLIGAKFEALVIVLICVNFLAIVYGAILIQNKIKNRKLAKLYPQVMQIYNTDPKVSKLRKQAIEVAKQLINVNFSEAEIDKYFEQQIGLGEVGYDFYLEAFEVRTIEQLRTGLKSLAKK